MTKTPQDKKQLVDIKGCYHILWKEPEHLGEIYESTYNFITKIIGKSTTEMNWPGIKTWVAGKPKGSKSASPIKRFVFGILALLYVMIGLILWIAIKTFGKPVGH